jgi:hypothetical protein
MTAMGKIWENAKAALWRTIRSFLILLLVLAMLFVLIVVVGLIFFLYTTYAEGWINGWAGSYAPFVHIFVAGFTLIALIGAIIAIASSGYTPLDQPADRP